MQVLLVDDSPVMRHFVARTLRMTGVDVSIHEAGDGREAVRLAWSLRPDLIITDLNMPEMSGEELIDNLRHTPELCRTPVIVVSAVRSPGKTQSLIGAGALAYMTKPLSPEALRRSLLLILESKT
jgi:two-component system chemotaxis response regulator CheY